MNIEIIKNTLLTKSAVKQQVYGNTLKQFVRLKQHAMRIANALAKEIEPLNAHVKVAFFDKGEFEFHLKFSGDTLVFMMHTNVFSFDPNHYVFETEYMEADDNRKYCGMIQVYNFLSDSLKYNRENDLGYLITRLFINAENHFIAEGKRSLALKYSNIDCCNINDDTLNDVILEAMEYCMGFDLIVPPVNMVSMLTVEQKNQMNYSSGMPTGKRMGFSMRTDSDVE